MELSDRRHSLNHMESFSSDAVARVFASYPPDVRLKLTELRALIFGTAKRIPAVGALEETLKWGQPSYGTSETKSGSTIRIDALHSRPGSFAIYFHCQTTLIETFKLRFGKKFRYKGNRALIFSTADKLPTTELRECITTALTYHLKKRGERTPIGRLIH